MAANRVHRRDETNLEGLKNLSDPGNREVEGKRVLISEAEKGSLSLSVKEGAGALDRVLPSQDLPVLRGKGRKTSVLHRVSRGGLPVANEGIRGNTLKLGGEAAKVLTGPPFGA